MKKISLLLAVGLATLVLTACSSSPKTDPVSDLYPTVADVAQTTPPASASKPAVVEPLKTPEIATKSQVTARTKTAPVAAPQVVTIQYSAFKPSTLTVKRGTIVKWVNKDSLPHTVTSNTFQSGMMQEGGFFTYQFDTVGNFPYSCKIHPSMKGGIIVKP